MNDLERRKYVPVSCDHRFGLYRVPVWVNDDEVTVCIGDDQYRYFRRHSIPSELKAAISMVNAFPYHPRAEWEVNPTNAYVPSYGTADEQMNIGWRVTNDLYIVILTREFIENIYMRS